MREVDSRSEGKMRLGPGTLYGSVKRMLNDGLVEELDERPDPELDDERRRYYRLTDLGRRIAVAEAERLDDAMTIFGHDHGVELEGLLGAVAELEGAVERGEDALELIGRQH